MDLAQQKKAAASGPMWKTALCGVAMGAADIVPGVSGGTVALVLGVYQRLLTALSHFDRRLLSHLGGGRWLSAARHLDLTFLLSLGVGIGSGILLLAGVLEHLLTHHRSVTYAAFFGLILASGVLVGRMVTPTSQGERVRCWLLGLLACGVAFWIASQGRLEAIPGLPYTLACGMIGICAMILPGISGAHLLLLLGKYEALTDILHRLPHGDVTLGDMTTVVTFAAGCLVGLLLFSRIIHWLLDHRPALTLAVLCGFMIGSLWRVWPFQHDTTPGVEEFKQKIFEPTLPNGLDGGTLACFAAAMGGLVLVFVADAIANRKKR